LGIEKEPQPIPHCLFIDPVLAAATVDRNAQTLNYTTWRC